MKTNVTKVTEEEEEKEGGGGGTRSVSLHDDDFISFKVKVTKVTEEEEEEGTRPVSLHDDDFFFFKVQPKIKKEKNMYYYIRFQLSLKKAAYRNSLGFSDSLSVTLGS